MKRNKKQRTRNTKAEVEINLTRNSKLTHGTHRVMDVAHTKFRQNQPTESEHVGRQNVY
jgi:hypothetical protein